MAKQRRVKAGRHVRPSDGAVAPFLGRAIRWTTGALLLSLPVVFIRTLPDAFEFPKMELLVTGAVLLAGLGLLRTATVASSWTSLPRSLIGWLRQDPLGAAVLAYLVSALLSTVFSMRPGLSLHGAPGSLAGLETAIATTAVFFASRSLASERGWFRTLAVAASTAAAIASAYALIQLMGIDPFVWEGFAEFGGRSRVFGTLAHPNILGAYLVMALPLITSASTRAESRTARAAWWIVSVAALMTVVATLSRGAWIGLAVMAVSYSGLSRLASKTTRKRTGAPKLFGQALLAAAAIALLLLTVPAIGPDLRARVAQLASIAAPTTQSRLELWRSGWRMGAEHPALGVGLDNYGTAFPMYRSPEYMRLEWGGNPTKAHNEMIHIFATQGTIGALAALAVVLLAALAVVRSIRSDDPEFRAGAVAAGAALAGFGAQALTGFTVIATGSLAAALAGWLSGAARPFEAAPAPHPSTRRAWVLGVPVFALGATLLVPLVVTPWRAAAIEYLATHQAVDSSARAEGYSRAAALLPWNDRYEQEAGRTYLIQAIRSGNREQAWQALENARRAFENAIRVAPESGIDRAYLASVLSSQSVLRPGSTPAERVSTVVREAANRDPANPYVLTLGEQALLAVHLESEAEEVARRLMRLYPGFAEPLADIGAMRLRNGRPEEAAAMLGIAVRNDWQGDDQGQARAWENLSTAYLRMGKYAEAEAAADSALERNASLPKASANRLQAIRLRALR